MSDFSSVLNDEFPFERLPVWSGILDTFRKKVVPHCWAVKAPLEWHDGLLKVMSRLYLCDSGGGDFFCGCGGCGGWRNFYHPDMVVVGELDKAGNIDACRSMIKELSLKPVVAKRRLGVLAAADKLLVNAANSLLKTAEEPPSHACLLFLMEGDDLLPTLRSRSRLSVLAAPMSFAAAPMPSNEAQWAEWLSNFQDDKHAAELLSSWTSYSLQTGDVKSAALTDKLRLLVLQKKLSQTMICDLLTLTLKEGLPFEPIFGGFW